MQSRAVGIRMMLVLTVLVLAITSIAIAQQNVSSGSDDDFDLDQIINRVTSSKALGFFTKLSLKKDIDGFLADVKKYHDGRGDLTLDQLHEQYDALVHNLVTLVQNKDEELVRYIDDGRDKLWGMLADHEKFATL